MDRSTRSAPRYVPKPNPPSCLDSGYRLIRPLRTEKSSAGLGGNTPAHTSGSRLKQFDDLPVGILQIAAPSTFVRPLIQIRGLGNRCRAAGCCQRERRMDVADHKTYVGCTGILSRHVLGYASRLFVLKQFEEVGCAGYLQEDGVNHGVWISDDRPEVPGRHGFTFRDHRETQQITIERETAAHVGDGETGVVRSYNGDPIHATFAPP